MNIITKSERREKTQKSETNWQSYGKSTFRQTAVHKTQNMRIIHFCEKNIFCQYE